jgi:hypothetical protein
VQNVQRNHLWVHLQLQANTTPRTLNIDCAKTISVPAADAFAGGNTDKSTSITNGAVYYLDQKNGGDSNDGKSVSTALASPKTAVKKLQPGDTLSIIGTLANPSYNPTYTFKSVSDSHLWHAEGTLVLSDVVGVPT